MNKKNTGFIIGIIVVILLLLGNPFYVLYEGEQAVITMLGKPQRTVVEAGLKVKIPFFEKVNRFEKRILEWDGDAREIPTQDKKYIWVDTTARWRIKDPLQFFKSVFNETVAQSRLDDIIDAAVKDMVRSHKLIEMVRTSNKVLEKSDVLMEKEEFIEQGALEKVKVGRDSLRKAILERARELAPQYGIELIDVRIKRINYIQRVREKVYERMIAERRRAAERYRSEGRGTRAEIEGQTEKELKAILSKAYKEAETIRGSADAEATTIYAEAYNKDPEFYSFLKTLETYADTVDSDTVVILSTEGDYYQYLKEISPPYSSQ